MRVLVAMSGGVDSSVAAALLSQRGHEVVGATLKLWGGPTDSGCCSVGDVEDAGRVAQQLGIPHHVFNMAERFDEAVVAPYVGAHAEGRTPNPCVECNRHIKFDALFARVERLGFDALATGHHARVDRRDGYWRLLRGADALKDQSYVLSMLDQRRLARVLFPVGELTKAEVRAEARRLGLRTAGKPDSQDVCFVPGGANGRGPFLAERLEFHPGTLVDQRSGAEVGRTDAVELVTVGQRRGMGHDERGRRRYVSRVDVAGRRVMLGSVEEVESDRLDLARGSLTWVRSPLEEGTAVLAQVSAHGRPYPAVLVGEGPHPSLRLATPQRPVAPGQTVALYDASDPAEVVGGAIAV